MISDRSQAKASDGAKEQCPVAKCTEVVSRMHAASHLPGIFDDMQDCTEELLRQRISALRILESLLLGSVANLMSLVDFVNQLRQIRSGQYCIAKRQNQGMINLCQLQGYPVPDQFTIAPANFSGVLLHWRVLLVLLACVNKKDRQDVINQYPVMPWRDMETLPAGFDSHFHL
ncbi:MAG: hypothetical protein AB2693_35210, partial [Candidatus Thiodiazotropha sp.]